MKKTVLSIDASSNGCSVALLHHNQTFTRISSQPRAHAQSLLPMIDEVFTEAGIGLSELDFIALVNGPGSFTGIRIAVSVTQGLAYGANVPVLCVSSLETMAFQALSLLNNESIIVSALDARMDEVYWSAYTVVDNNTVPKEVVPPSVSSKSHFTESLNALVSEGNILCGVGSGFSVDGIELQQMTSMYSDLEPEASSVLSMLECSGEFAEKWVSAEKIEPLYLRNEVAWKKRERIRSQKS